jgi:hypothetical protein
MSEEVGELHASDRLQELLSVENEDDVVVARKALAAMTRELAFLSAKLAQTSRKLEILQKPYQKFMDNYEIQLLIRAENEEKYKLPSADLRIKRGRAEYTVANPEEVGLMMAFEASIDRMEKRISTLNKMADAQGKVLAGLKTELQAGMNAAPPTYERPIGGRRS